jgi:exosome complex exonuclease RRP6
VYDQLREALLEKGKSRSSSPAELMETGENLHVADESKDETRHIRKVLKDSESTSLNVFMRESYDTEKGEGMRGWAGLLRKWNKRVLMIDGVPRNVYLAVHAWRDQVRSSLLDSQIYSYWDRLLERKTKALRRLILFIHDQIFLRAISVRFILSNQLLLNLLEKPIPENLSTLYSSFPGVVPPMIRKRGNELLQLVQDAVAKAQEQSTTLSKARRTNNQLVTAENVDMINVEKPKHIVFPTQAIPVSDLWKSVRVLDNAFDGSQSLQHGETSIIANKSSLFGGILDANTSQHHERLSLGRAKLSIQSSVLFSNGIPAASHPARGTVKESNAGQVQKAIIRIHEGILKSEKKVGVTRGQASFLILHRL